jgi:ribose transport system substrate-binding protein
MKKLIAILLVLVMVAGLVACTPAQEGEKTIAVIAKGETHAFWQAVKAGAVKAGEEAGYKVTFQGPTSESESEVPNQRNMVQTALNNPNVKAIVLATIGTGFVDELTTAFDKKIPVVEFDSGLYAGGADITEGKDPTIGLVATDNKKAGALVAENFYAYLKAQNVLTNGFKIGVIQHDSTATGIDRAEGFVEKINALAAADSITLDIQLEKKQNNAGEYKLALSSLKEWGAQAIYMTNEGVVNEVYPEVKDQVDAYKSILFCGFDCGTNQYEWIKDGGATCALLVGSVAQDSYNIGYESVKMAIAKLEGKEVQDVGIGGAWYTKENIDELKDKNVFYMG